LRGVKIRIELNGIKIIGTGSAFPKQLVTNLELKKHSPIDPVWAENVLGISSRYILSDQETLSQLVFEAGNKAILSSKISVKPDLVIVATSTPDYVNPSMACILHEKLSLPDNSPAFDIQAVCNGFLYALANAGTLLEASKGSYALVVGADQFSKITDFSHRNSVYFGDAAGAVILEKDQTGRSKFVFDLYASGQDWVHFHTKNNETKFSMNGSSVAEIVNNKVPQAVRKLLNDLGLKINDIDKFITHQPSALVLDNLEKELKIPEGKLIRNLNTNANTAGATVPTVLDSVFNALNQDSIICLISFGSGWTWSVGIIGNM
jgi:3-oxoacyl-[acyl-carrier-protein] synthase-3